VAETKKPKNNTMEVETKKQPVKAQTTKSTPIPNSPRKNKNKNKKKKQ